MQLQLQLQQEQLRGQLELNRLVEEKNRIRQHEVKIKEKDSELARFQEENKILLMDLSNCADFVREHFLAMQNDILQRRMHGGSGSGNN